jgi:hypothetical protein
MGISLPLSSYSFMDFSLVNVLGGMGIPQVIGYPDAGIEAGVFSLNRIGDGICMPLGFIGKRLL